MNCAVGLERQLDERLTVGRVIEAARLHRDHLSVRASHDFDGRFRRLNVHVATYDQSALLSEGNGTRPADASARARDNAHLL